MKSIVSVVLSISLIFSSVAPSYAQAQGAVKVFTKAPRYSGTLSTKNHTKALQIAGNRQFTASTRAFYAELAGAAEYSSVVSAKELRQKLQQEVYSARIKAKSGLEAPTAAEIDAYLVDKISNTVNSFKEIPVADINTLISAQDPAFIKSLEALERGAAYAQMGAQPEVLTDFYKQAKGSVLEEVSLTITARGLLRMKAYVQLRALYAKTSSFGVWKGIQRYATESNIPLVLGVPQGEVAVNEGLREFLGKRGNGAVLHTDASYEATKIWMEGFKPEGVPARSAQGKAPEAVAETPVVAKANTEPVGIPVVDVTATAPLTVAPLNAGLGSGVKEPVSAEVKAVAAPTGASAVAAKASSTSGVLYGGVPFFAMADFVKRGYKAFRGWFAKKQPKAPVQTAKATASQKGIFQKAGAIRQQINDFLIKKLLKNKTTPVDQAALTPRQQALQRASIYLASAVMGFEVATPIIASIGESFGFSISQSIWVAVATYVPYSIGAFLSNFLKKALGRKASLNLGLTLMGSSLLAGYSLLGLDGSFVAEADPMAHFYKILLAITCASMGGVLIHGAAGPLITNLGKTQGASELSLQKRNAYVELSRSIGMMSSFAFPWISTAVLGMDWSLAFALPIPIVAASLVGLNAVKIPNTKIEAQKPEIRQQTSIPLSEVPQAGSSNRAVRARTSTAFSVLQSIKNNEYISLFKEQKGVGALLAGLSILNMVEMCFNNGFLFMLPSLTENPSSQYIFGLLQFAIPFLIGRYLAVPFMKFFPKHSMSIATALAAASGLASMAVTNNVYALTAALFLSEVGISTTFTLAFARTAQNTKTQDRITSLIIAAALSCAVGPMLLSHLAEFFTNTGIASAGNGATSLAMIAVPATLAAFTAALFYKMEKITVTGITDTAKTGGLRGLWQKWIAKIKSLFGK